MDQFCIKCETLLTKGPICECSHKNKVNNSSSTITIWFNKRKDLLLSDNAERDPQTEGPRVEKYCNKCSQLTMQTYFTAQLRSADEGQTVFYRCTICLIQTSENS